MCVFCQRINRVERNWTCEAFPDGIPDPISFHYIDHREPFEGDQGLRFIPVDDLSKKLVDEFYNELPEGGMPIPTVEGMTGID